jgi:hypothetical protein
MLYVFNFHLLTIIVISIFLFLFSKLCGYPRGMGKIIVQKHKVSPVSLAAYSGTFGS